MDMQSFGRELAQVIGARSLELLRNATMGDVRDVVTGRFLRPQTTAVPVVGALAAFVAGAAIGAGLTAFLTPTTGPELQKRVARSTRGARKQAMELGEAMASQVDHARHAVMESVDHASTAIGLKAPAVKRRASNGAHAANGRAKRIVRQAQA